MKLEIRKIRNENQRMESTDLRKMYCKSEDDDGVSKSLEVSDIDGKEMEGMKHNSEFYLTSTEMVDSE